MKIYIDDLDLLPEDKGGIYFVCNALDETLYIGTTDNFKRRLKLHEKRYLFKQFDATYFILVRTNSYRHVEKYMPDLFRFKLENCAINYIQPIINQLSNKNKKWSKPKPNLVSKAVVV